MVDYPFNLSLNESVLEEMNDSKIQSCSHLGYIHTASLISAHFWFIAQIPMWTDHDPELIRIRKRMIKKQKVDNEQLLISGSEPVVQNTNWANLIQEPVLSSHVLVYCSLLNNCSSLFKEFLSVCESAKQAIKLLKTDE